MAGFTARVLGLSVWLLVFLSVAPVNADPFFVEVYGRTYKVDPRYPPNELKGPTPQEAMEALPADIAQGPSFRPLHEQVLAEVEERIWIARNQLVGELEETAASQQWRNTGGDTKTDRAGDHGISRERSSADPCARLAAPLRPPQGPGPSRAGAAAIHEPAGEVA